MQIIMLSEQQRDRNLAPWKTGMTAVELRDKGYHLPESIPNHYALFEQKGDGFTHVFLSPVVPEFCLAV